MYLTKLTINISILLLLMISACNQNQEEVTPAEPQPPQATLPTPGETGCQSCHPYVLKNRHAELACTTCHAGNDQASDFDQAHTSLISRPAHPENMQSKCGNCHNQTSTADKTSHFTLKNEMNMVRRHFGADHDLDTLQEIPTRTTPSTPLQLADDLLRRRCLRCHVYYEGDEYANIRHGTGCAACHLEYQDGQLVSHEFKGKPADSQCLSCHSGNRVGSDYYGRFDHDFKHEYRTPYQPDGSYPPRPYGVEQHLLTPDSHQLAGMTCIDCHLTMHSSRTMETISCEACHLRDPQQPLPAPHLRTEQGELVLKTRLTGHKIIVPAASNEIHSRYQEKVACTVCHAQWSYNEQNTNLLRIDHDDYDEWDELFVQDSSEVEVLLLNGIYGDEILTPTMTDKITGISKTGLWLKGYKIRRWEDPIIDFDQKGKLQVMRPILDLYLSWVDEESKTVFDSIKGQTERLRPYTPHTIGKAGTFYHQRLEEMFPPQASANK